MSQQEFETQVLHLWMTTRVPMTRANLLFYTKAPRKRVGAWLDEMVADGVLEVDADNDGEMIWSVRGAQRPDNGAERLEEAGPPASGGPAGDLASQLAQLKKRAIGTGAGMVLASQAKELLRAPREGEKSLVLSGLLSTFFGPFGLLYAAPFRVAVPLSVAMLVLAYFFGWSILGFSLIFGALGVGYAWRYNQAGQRAPLLGGGDDSSDGDTGRALPRKR